MRFPAETIVMPKKSISVDEKILNFMRGYYIERSYGYTHDLLRTVDLAKSLKVARETARTHLTGLLRRHKVKRVKIGGRRSRYYGWGLPGVI